jgi:hypothetical protein
MGIPFMGSWPSTKRFALEVNAIDPFISSLDENTQNDLKRQFSEKLFGNSSIAPETAASGSWDSIVEKFVKHSSSLFQAVQKNDSHVHLDHHGSPGAVTELNALLPTSNVTEVPITLTFQWHGSQLSLGRRM